MSDLIELLDDLNSKERFFLVRQALGEFQLGADFRQELGEAIGLAIPSGAFSWMDYHLDWLVAALRAYESGRVDGIFDHSQGLQPRRIACVVSPYPWSAALVCLVLRLPGSWTPWFIKGLLSPASCAVRPPLK